MRIYSQCLALIVLLSLSGIIGCQKKDKEDAPPSDTISGAITGQWKVVKFAYDENFNLVIDGDEIEIPSPQFSAIVP